MKSTPTGSIADFGWNEWCENMTDAKRTGAIDAPFKLGDQILITYRMNTRKLQNYVALEDSLPAGLETVNPNLAMIGKFFELPAR